MSFLEKAQGVLTDVLTTAPGLEFNAEYNSWVESWNRLAVYPLLYLIVVTLLYRIQAKETSKPIDGTCMKRIMQLYNLVQVGVCFYMVRGLGKAVLWNGYKLEATLEAFQFNLKSFYAIGAPRTKDLEFFVLVHFWSKILDFCDTIFIILRKKWNQLNFLHVYHHASIIYVWAWLLMRGVANSTVVWGAWINSIIHCLMYSHYFIRSIGLPNPLSFLLTQAQIGQFWLCIVHASLNIYLASEYSVEAGVQVAYHISMITLFSAFYKKKYKGKKGDKQKKN